MISFRTSSEMRGEEAKLPSEAALSTLPPPEEFEALAMPGQNRCWLQHSQTFPPAVPEDGEQGPEDAVDGPKLWPCPLMYQARELMAQRNILRDEISTVLENGSNS